MADNFDLFIDWDAPVDLDANTRFYTGRITSARNNVSGVVRPIEQLPALHNGEPGLTRAEMESVMAGGQGMIVGGRVVPSASDLPSNAGGGTGRKHRHQMSAVIHKSENALWSDMEMISGEWPTPEASESLVLIRRVIEGANWLQFGLGMEATIAGYAASGVANVVDFYGKLITTGGQQSSWLLKRVTFKTNMLTSYTHVVYGGSTSQRITHAEAYVETANVPRVNICEYHTWFGNRCNI